MLISPASIEALRALALGFAFAGLLASAYELLMSRRLGFDALRSGDASALASVPVVVFSAPFLILRGVLRAGSGTRTFPAVFLATLGAGFWSLACGRFVLDTASRLIGA
jgi:hypothetical protein